MAVATLQIQCESVSSGSLISDPKYVFTPGEIVVLRGLIKVDDLIGDKKSQLNVLNEYKDSAAKLRIGVSHSTYSNFNGCILHVLSLTDYSPIEEVVVKIV